jgi:hypothetical protein
MTWRRIQSAIVSEAKRSTIIRHSEIDTGAISDIAMVEGGGDGARDQQKELDRTSTSYPSDGGLARR